MPGIVNVAIGKLGFKMVFNETNQCDVDLAECLRRFGSPEPEVVKAMERIVRFGDTVIDGGANMGFFTLVLSRLVGQSGRVIAVEPGQNNLWELKHNIALNDLKNVTVVEKPLWGSHQKLEFYLYSHGGWNSVSNFAHYEKAVELDSVTLADLAPEPPRLVKLDIEGAEEDVLRGLVPGTQFIVCEMNHKALGRMGASPKSLRESMRRLGYDTFLLRPDGLLPVYVPERTEIICEIEVLNVLFCSLDDMGSVWRTVELKPSDDPK